jgi:predicted Zn-dependent protease
MIAEIIGITLFALLILASIALHEIGHLVKGHVEKPFRRELLAGRLVPGVPQVSDTLNTVLKNSPYNQADEEEADCFAVEIHRKKKWSLEGGVRFFKRIHDEESRSNDKDAATGTIDAMFSSHPDHERRIEVITNGCDS